MDALISVLLLAGGLLSAFGWGRGIATWAYGRVPGGPAFAATLGVAALTVIGGGLNLAGLAFPAVLIGAFGFGLVLALPSVGSSMRAAFAQGAAKLRWSPETVLRLLILSAGALIAASMAPSFAFNHHDDFHSYFPRVARMLQSGTVGGNPFDSLGVDSLGGLVFWHGAITAVAGLHWVNLFESAFCLTLAGLLVFELGAAMGASRGSIFAAVAVLFAITPQIVNISSVYSGVLLTIGFVAAMIVAREDRARDHVPAGLILGAVVTLKTTYLPLAGLILIVMAALRVRRLGKAGVRPLVVLGAVAAASLAPWFALHFRNFTGLVSGSKILVDTSPPMRRIHEGLLESDLLSTATNFYGIRPALFLACLLGVLCVSAVALFRASRVSPAVPQSAALPAAAGVGLAAVAVYALALLGIEGMTAIRYATPGLLVALVVQLCAAGTLAGAGSPAAGRRGNIVAVVVGSLIVIACFENLGARIKSAVEFRSPLAYPADTFYLRSNQLTMGPSGKGRMMAVQSSIPPGQPALAFVTTAFHLDFKRNPIMTVAEPGWANPWLGLPIGEPAEAWAGHLRAKGIRYLIWEHTGYGIESDARWTGFLRQRDPAHNKVGLANLHVRRALRQIAQAYPAVFDQAGVRVTDLGQ